MILLLLLLWLIVIIYRQTSNSVDRFIKEPQKGQVYIFSNKLEFAPMLLDSVDGDFCFFRNYNYVFADAIPARKQIETKEFDFDFFAIYEQSELRRLANKGQIVEIYP